MRKTIIALLMIMLITIPYLHAQEKDTYRPPEGYVPNEATAIKIAEAVWLPIYGESIYNERPFVAKLKDGIWTVSGTLPEGYLGGVATCEISKETGEILKVIHYK